MSEESPPSPRPLGAERNYARFVGWVYLGLGVAGVFTNNLWHMFNLSGTMTAIHIGLGIGGLTVALRGGSRAHRGFNLIAGTFLTAWGVAGTVTPEWLSPHPLPLENALHTLTGVWGFYGAGSSFFGRIGGRRRPRA